MNLRELEDALDRILKRDGGVDGRKVLMKAWMPKEGPKTLADMEEVRYRAIHDPATLSFEDAVLFRRATLRSPLDIAEAKSICSRMLEFKRQLRARPPLLLGGDIALMDYAARQSVVLAYILVPALAAVGRFAEAERHVRYFVKSLTRPVYRRVYGAMDGEFRFGLIGAPVSELVALFSRLT